MVINNGYSLNYREKIELNNVIKIIQQQPLKQLTPTQKNILKKYISMDKDPFVQEKMHYLTNTLKFNIDSLKEPALTQQTTIIKPQTTLIEKTTPTEPTPTQPLPIPTQIITTEQKRKPLPDISEKPIINPEKQQESTIKIFHITQESDELEKALKALKISSNLENFFSITNHNLGVFYNYKNNSLNQSWFTLAVEKIYEGQGKNPDAGDIANFLKSKAIDFLAKALDKKSTDLTAADKKNIDECIKTAFMQNKIPFVQEKSYLYYTYINTTCYDYRGITKKIC